MFSVGEGKYLCYKIAQSRGTVTIKRPKHNFFSDQNISAVDDCFSRTCVNKVKMLLKKFQYVGNVYYVILQKYFFLLQSFYKSTCVEKGFVRMNFVNCRKTKEIH